MSFCRSNEFDQVLSCFRQKMADKVKPELPKKPTRSKKVTEIRPVSSTLSDYKCINDECIHYIEQVYRCLNYLIDVDEELSKEFAGNEEITKRLIIVFRDIKSMKSAYEIILETIKKLKSRSSDNFYLYEVLLDPIVSNILKIYKSFLNQYSVNGKWIGEFYRENQNCNKACERVSRMSQVMDNGNVDHCLYTVFNSLFSLELMFDRYCKCFKDSSEQHQKTTEAKNIISSILSTVNTNQDQENFLLTQKELNLITGKSRESKINTKFIYKGVVTKFARRDDKLLSRQLVLFSDCLYVTLLPGNIFGTSSVRQELSIDSIKLSEIHEDDPQNTTNLRWGLTINAHEAVQDFFFEDKQTMQLWKDKILNVIKENNNTESINDINVTSKLVSLGLNAPRWQKDSAASYCNGYRCNQKFSTAVRRHHCRADGLLYCDNCCNFKVNLKFEKSPESRVCELCYNILHLYQNDLNLQEEAKKLLAKVIIKKTHTGRLLGWLSMKSFDKEKNVFQATVKYYCEVELFSSFFNIYEKPEDKYHLERLLLSGVNIITEDPPSYYNKTLSANEFILEDISNAKVYFVRAQNVEDYQRWVECIQEKIDCTKEYSSDSSEGFLVDDI